MKKKETPKWFEGVVYKTGKEVQNPFSKEKYKLTGLELSIYDFIIGCQWMFEMQPSNINNKHVKTFHKALNWFRVNNPDAYYVLLD